MAASRLVPTLLTLFRSTQTSSSISALASALSTAKIPSHSTWPTPTRTNASVPAAKTAPAQATLLLTLGTACCGLKVHWTATTATVSSGVVLLATCEYDSKSAAFFFSVIFASERAIALVKPLRKFPTSALPSLIYWQMRLHMQCSTSNSTSHLATIVSIYNKTPWNVYM